MRAVDTRTLRERVFLTLLPFLLFAIGLGGAGTALLRHLGGLVDLILRENYTSVVAMERLNESLERIDSSFAFALAGHEQVAATQYEENWRDYRENLRIEQSTVTLPSERERVHELAALTERYRTQGQAFFALGSTDARRQEDYFGRGGLLETFNQIKRVRSAILALNEVNMVDASAYAKRTAVLSTAVLAAGLAVTVLFSLLLAWSANRALAKLIRRFTAAAVGVSQGQLDWRVVYTAHDELGELATAFNHMVDQLRASRQAIVAQNAELRRAEERYRSIFENAVEGFFQCTPDDRFATVNQALAEMLGFASDAELMQSIRHIGAGLYGDPERFAEFKRRLLRDGVVRGFEANCVRNDQSTVWLSFNARAVRDGDGQLQLYEGFVSNLSERKRAEQEVARLAHLQATVAEFGHRALRIAPSTDLQSDVVQLIASALDVELVNVMELRADGKTFLLRAGSGWREALVGRATVSGEGTQPGATLLAERPIVIEDVQAETRFVPVATLLGEQAASSLSVVIPMQKGAYGTIGVHTRRLRRFSADEMNFLHALANVLGAAIERRNVERALAESQLNLNRAQEIARLGSWHLDIASNRLTYSDEVFRIFELPLQTPPPSYEAFHAMVHPSDRGRVDNAWAAAVGGGSYDIEHRIVVHSGAAGEKWVRARAAILRDSDGKPREAVGTVQDITERRRAQEGLRRMNRAHRALSSCNHALVRASDEHAWIKEVCRVIVDDAGYRLCWVGSAQSDREKSVRVVAAAGGDDGYVAGLRISWADEERGRGPTGAAIRSGAVVLARDIASNPNFAPWRSAALERGYASSIAIPIVVEGRAFGALNIYASEPDAFAEEEVALLTELAEDLAYGISALRTRTERDRALDQLHALTFELESRVEHRTAELRESREREASIGAKIQRQLLLDRPPRDIAGLQLAALTLPSQHISGDFYGFFPYEGRDCIDLLVADVMGKGVPAALLAAATKSHFPEALWHLISAAPGGAPPEPHAIVTLAHAHMAHQLIQLESFVTLCYARIDVAARRLQVVDCGHNSLLHLKARTGELDRLHGDNLPLGVREGELFGEMAVPLEPDDLLVFYSDGVTEARNGRGELFGAQRLLECVRSARDLDVEALSHALRDAVLEFSGARSLADDVTCVVAKLVPYVAARARADLSIGSRLAELQRARTFVEEFCKTAPGQRLTAESTAELVLAVNEAVSNIIKHAYRRREDQRIEIAAEAFRDRIAVRLRYLGPPFDPSAVAQPPFNGSRDSGFGVFMIANSVDAVRYYRDDLWRCCIRLEKCTGERATRTNA